MKLNEKLNDKLSEIVKLCGEIDSSFDEQAVYLELQKYLSYLAASDGSISDEEISFINYYLNSKFRPRELANFISAHDTYSKKFESTPSEIFKKVIASKADTSLYLSFLEILGKEFIVSDKDVNETEVENLNTYLANMYEIYNIEHPEDMLVYRPACVSGIENYEYKGDDKEETLSSLLNELDALIGLDSVKKNVYSLIHLQDIQHERELRGIPKIPMSNHLVFTGNPGTGKTTVARLIARIYYHLGILSTGNFVEVDRSGMVAGYVGQTAIKVTNVIDSAMGGVLFIDEAYALSNSGLSMDYGQESITTLLKRMEDDREDLVIIVAGYPKLMEGFLASNPGLKSRFSKKIHFPDYAPDELLEILQYMAKKNSCTISDEALVSIKNLFEEKYENRGENFANAREVRNFFESAVMSQADRLFGQVNLSDEDLCRLEKEDFKPNELMFDEGITNYNDSNDIDTIIQGFVKH